MRINSPGFKCMPLLAPEIDRLCSTLGPDRVLDFTNVLTDSFMTDRSFELYNSVKLLNEIADLNVENVLVVGSGLISLPLIMGYSGRETTFLDMNEATTCIYKILNITGFMKKYAKVKCITEEFGTMNPTAYDIKPYSFDLITMIDLAGGGLKGDPLQWFEISKEILKPNGFILMDEDKDNRDAVFAAFNKIFPNNFLVSNTIIQGMYSSHSSTNRLYRVSK